MWQERLSGVASLTNPAGCNQLVKAKQIPKQIARVHTITLWMKRPCHLKTLQEMISLPPGNFQRLKSSYLSSISRCLDIAQDSAVWPVQLLLGKKLLMIVFCQVL